MLLQQMLRREYDEKKPLTKTPKKEYRVLIFVHSSDVFISYGGDQKRVKGKLVWNCIKTHVGSAPGPLIIRTQNVSLVIHVNNMLCFGYIPRYLGNMCIYIFQRPGKSHIIPYSFVSVKTILEWHSRVV